MDYQHPLIAEIYDLANPRAQDTDFYLSLTGMRPCSVLDIGCGTGTLCCAFAERGHRVTGVDPAAAMLAVARRKPRAEHVEWVESCAQNYKARRRFDLIVMTGHAFQVLLTDADALAALETMRRHLKQRGRVAFETRNPRMDWVSEWAARPPLVRMSPSGQLLETLEITGKDGEFISLQTSYRFPQVTLTTSSTLRFPSRDQVEVLIAGAGLVVRHVFGDWMLARSRPHAHEKSSLSRRSPDDSRQHCPPRSDWGFREWPPRSARVWDCLNFKVQEECVAHKGCAIRI